jgi:hypothetical protein
MLQLNMRNLLLFVVSAAMFVGGLYFLGAELLADRIHFWFIITGAMLVALGPHFLWADFIAPLFGIKEER